MASSLFDIFDSKKDIESVTPTSRRDMSLKVPHSAPTAKTKSSGYAKSADTSCLKKSPGIKQIRSPLSDVGSPKPISVKETKIFNSRTQLDYQHSTEKREKVGKTIKTETLTVPETKIQHLRRLFAEESKIREEDELKIIRTEKELKLMMKSHCIANSPVDPYYLPRENDDCDDDVSPENLINFSAVTAEALCSSSQNEIYDPENLVHSPVPLLETEAYDLESAEDILCLSSGIPKPVEVPLLNDY